MALAAEILRAPLEPAGCSSCAIVEGREICASFYCARNAARYNRLDRVRDR